jgi:hypothetical protein
MLLATVSACTTALIDAAFASRVSERVIPSRPLWLHTFSIAALTIVVAAVALWTDDLAFTVRARVAYAVAAVLNLTVPLLRQRHSDLHLVLPVLHLVLAAMLIGMVVLARTASASCRHRRS